MQPAMLPRQQEKICECKVFHSVSFVISSMFRKDAAGKKLDEAQKTGEALKKKASDGVEDLWVQSFSFSFICHFFVFRKDAAAKTGEALKKKAGKKHRKKKPTGEALKKKASDGVDDLWVKRSSCSFNEFLLISVQKRRSEWCRQDSEENSW